MYQGRGQPALPRPKPLDPPRIKAMINQWANQSRGRAASMFIAYDLGIITATEKGQGYDASVMFACKYDWNMLEVILENDGVEPPEWKDLSFQEVSSALRVQGVLADRRRPV